MTEPQSVTASSAEAFIKSYESARLTGDTVGLKQHLDLAFRFDDPQLPDGCCDANGLLELLGKFADCFDDLRVKRLGPCCFSSDGGTFVQRWLIDGLLAGDGAGGAAQAVHLETVECFEQRDGVVVRMTILTRDLISQSV
ncbi:MAG: hypothetical protein AB7F94_16135 [Nitrospira sp.]